MVHQVRHVSKWRDWCVSESVCKSGDSAISLAPLGTSEAEAAHSQSRLQGWVLQSFQFSLLLTSSYDIFISFTRRVSMCESMSIFGRLNLDTLCRTAWPQERPKDITVTRRVYQRAYSVELLWDTSNTLEILGDCFIHDFHACTILSSKLAQSVVLKLDWFASLTGTTITRGCTWVHQNKLSSFCPVSSLLSHTVQRLRHSVTPFHCLQLKQMYTKYAWAFPKAYKTRWNLDPGNRSSHSTGPIDNLWGNQTHCRSPGPARTGLAERLAFWRFLNLPLWLIPKQFRTSAGVRVNIANTQQPVLWGAITPFMINCKHWVFYAESVPTSSDKSKIWTNTCQQLLSTAISRLDSDSSLSAFDLNRTVAMSTDSWISDCSLRCQLFHPSPQLFEQYDHGLQSYHLWFQCSETHGKSCEAIRWHQAVKTKPAILQLRCWLLRGG